MNATLFNKLEIALFTILFLFYGFLCIHFYVERTTLTDNAFYLFKMVQTESFNVEHLRYGAVTTQWLVVLLIKIHASLKTILLAYSLNVYLQYLFIFCIIRFYLKESLMAWCVIAYMMTTIHYGYFYMACELVYGGTWICLLLATINSIEKNNANRKINYVLLLISIMFLFFTHAFLLVISSLILSFLVIHNFSKLKAIIIGALILVFFIKLKFLTDGYESGKFTDLNKNIFIPQTINQSYFTYFFKQQINSVFVFVKVFWIIALVVLAIKQKWKFILSALLSLLGLYLVIYSLMPNGESLAYMDSYQSMWYLTGWIFLSYMISFYFEKYKQYYIAVLFLLGLVGLYNINKGKIYTERIQYYTRIMQDATQKDCNKIFVNVEQIDMQKVLLTWATPYETLLLSSLNGQSQTIFINGDVNFDIDKYNQPGKFLGVVWLLDKKTPLNSPYFNLGNTKYCLWQDIYKN